MWEIGAEDWEREQETLYVLQNPSLMEQIQRSLKTSPPPSGQGRGGTIPPTAPDSAASPMKDPDENLPDLSLLKGVVAPEILNAAETASRKLREAGIPHALAGGLAVGAHGYPRTTDDVDFLVGDEAFETHAGGLVTLKLPLVSVGGVRVDFVSIDDSQTEREQTRSAVDHPAVTREVPVVPLSVLVYMKLKAGRQKDLADVVELLKRGRIEIEEVDLYLREHAPHQLRRWERVKEIAAREE